MMEEKPYFCPRCRSNRTKFRVINRVSNQIQKDAFDGSVVSMDQEEPYISDQGEKEVECLVCHYVAYEMMFIKSAEREPRFRTEVRGRGE